jgi:RNA polymerase sigma-70 factor (ECF subfamily)
MIEQLVQRAQAGEMSAWSRLYQDNFERIYRHVRALTGDPHLSEELVQETFVQALLRIASFDGRSAFSTWLHGVAINVVRNHWRSQKSTARAHARLEIVRPCRPAAATSPALAVHRQQRVKALYAALETLPDHLRVAFVLRDLEGLSPEEAADRLDISPGNLAVRATRARQRIRKQLIEWGILTGDAEARP